MARILLKVVNVFRSENLALFVATSIHSIRKSTKKKRNSQTRWNPRWKVLAINAIE